MPDMLFISRWKEGCQVFKKGDSQLLPPSTKCVKEETLQHLA